MDYKAYQVEYLLDEKTQKHLSVVCEAFKRKYHSDISVNEFFQMMMTEGSQNYINDKLNSYAYIINQKEN